MRIVVFGASGGIGSRLVQQALARGHEVTAVIRASSGATFEAAPGLQVAVADVMDPAAVEPVIVGSDAVLSAVGPRKEAPDSRVCEDSARSLLTAMEATGVKRIEVVSGSGPYPEGSGFVMRRVAKPIGRRFLRHTFDDMIAMDHVVAESGLEWTSIRPPRLTDKPGTGHYRTSRNRDLRFAVTAARADVAHFMLEIVDDPTTFRAAYFVAN